MDLRQPGALEQTHFVLFEFGTLLDEDLARLRIDDLFGHDPSQQLPDIVFETGYRGRTRLEEEPVDLGVVTIPEGAQERRGRELLLLVDVNVADVVDVDGEFDPRTPEGDDPRLVQPRAVGVDVLLEHDAGRAVQLAHDDPFRPVDDEGSQGGEQRKVPEVDLLLDDGVRPALLPPRLLEDDQAQRRLQRCRVGHVTFDALLHGVLGLAQGARHVLQRQVPVHVVDREDVPEHAIEAEIPAFHLCFVGFDQLPEGTGLYIQQVGHGHGRVELRKAHDRPGPLDGTVLTSQ